MAEEQRNSAFHATLLVDEMDIQWFEAVDLDCCFEIGQPVELGFLRPPVIFILPVRCQAFDLGQWGSIVPAGFVELVRKRSSVNLSGELLEAPITNRYLIEFNSGHGNVVSIEWVHAEHGEDAVPVV